MAELVLLLLLSLPAPGPAQHSGPRHRTSSHVSPVLKPPHGFLHYSEEKPSPKEGPRHFSDLIPHYSSSPSLELSVPVTALSPFGSGTFQEYSA